MSLLPAGTLRKVYCGKTADWIRISFGVVSGVGRGMGVLNGGGCRRMDGSSSGVNVGHPIVTNWDCGVVILCRKGWPRASFQITLAFLI